MPLTPEDVVNKRFQPTKFREGYDQDEVDDFLDEVVAELRRLSEVNDELQKRLETAESAGASAHTKDDAPEGAGAESDPIVDAVLGTETDLIVDAVVEEPDAVPASPDPSEGAAVESTPADGSAESSSGLLRLARRLHDEHVQEGIDKRDALIADGDAARARAVAEGESARERVLLDAEAARALVVADAEAERDRVVADGHLEADRVLSALGERQIQLVAALEAERGDLEEQVGALQEFEREYRDQLRSYIEGQLRELDATESPEGTGGYDDADAVGPVESEDSGGVGAAEVVEAAAAPDAAGEFDAAEEFALPEDPTAPDETTPDESAPAASSPGSR